MHLLPRVILAVLVLGTVGCEKKTPKPSAPAAALSSAPAGGDVLLLGEVGSLTGAQAAFGISSRNGIEMAIDEANAAGGVKGRKLVVRLYDSQGRAEEAAQAATRLITQDHVVAILGEVSSTNSVAMARKAQAAQVPMISHAATNPSVTQQGDYIFRTCFIDPFQGWVMARFARENLKLERVAILQDNKSDYSVGLTQVFTRDFTKLGGQVVATETYSQGDTDFRPQLTRLKSMKPQALYLPGYYTDVGLIARQAREQGLRVPLLGGDGWDSERIFELAGNALEGGYFSDMYAPDDPSPRAREYGARYKAVYGSAPDVVAVLAYDSARVVIDALQRASDLSGPAVREALTRTRDFPGVAGSITLDAERNAVRPAVVIQIVDGGFKYVTTLRP